MTQSVASVSLGRYSYNPRSQEFYYLKIILVVFLIVEIVTSIWVCLYASQIQAEYELANNIDNVERWEGVRAWTIWTICIQVFGDVFCVIFICQVWREKWIIILAVLSFIYAIYGISSAYTRGSITAFVVPMTIATISFILVYFARKEDDDYEITRVNARVTGVKQ